MVDNKIKNKLMIFLGLYKIDKVNFIKKLFSFNH